MALGSCAEYLHDQQQDLDEVAAQAGVRGARAPQLLGGPPAVRRANGEIAQVMFSSVRTGASASTGYVQSSAWPAGISCATLVRQSAPPLAGRI